MALTHGRIAVAATATLITSAPAGGGARSEVDGASVVVRNRGAISIDVGGADVVSGAGYELAPGEWLSFDLDPGEGLYGIAASGTVRVDWIRNRA